jgi:DNA-binding PadR family transcriptional regulator
MGRLPNTSPQTVRVLEALLEAPIAWHYGYALSRRTGLRSGTLYPLLMRLAEHGWLETRWIEPERPGRPPRHTYRLTTEGARAAAAQVASARAVHRETAHRETAQPLPGLEGAGA